MSAALADITVAISTRNRSASLAATLDALSKTRLPHGVQAELVVVDNGSTDETAKVIREASFPGPVLRLWQPTAGLSTSRNAAVAASYGRAILFTDDDVRVTRDWVWQMAEPLLTNRVAAVAGGVMLAPHLVRPWMEDLHRAMLAEFAVGSPYVTGTIVGASMGISRMTFERIGPFDPELGAGAIGTGEEAFFARRMSAAGLEVHRAVHIVAEHHCSEARLSNDVFLSTAVSWGRFYAWMLHHWEHGAIPFAKVRAARLLFKARRIRNRRTGGANVASADELHTVQSWAFVDAISKLGAERRIYDRFSPKRSELGPCPSFTVEHLCLDAR